jgi:hypothetical protein
MFDFSRQKTLESVDHSLKLLGLDYVDIIQVGLYSYATKFPKTFIKFCTPLMFTQYKTLVYTQLFKWLRDIKLFRKLPGTNNAVCYTQHRISTDLPFAISKKVHTFNYFLEIILMLYYFLLFTLPCGFLTYEFPPKILYAIFVFPSLSSLTQTFQITFISLERSSVGVVSNNFKIQTEQTGGDRE